MIVSLVIGIIWCFGLILGYRRGLRLVVLEVLCLAFATLVALFLYGWVGKLTVHALGQLAQADTVAFVTTWMLAEIGAALICRIWLLPHWRRFRLQSTVWNVVAGLLNGAKYVVITMFILAVYVDLPMSQSAVSYVTDASLPHALLTDTGFLKDWDNSPLGGAISQSLNFYTVSADPESTERIKLGFSTTAVTIDPTAEIELLNLLNQARARNGLPALLQDTAARSVARDHSLDMFAHGYFSHISLNGENPFDRMRKAGIKFGSAGENLALAPSVALANSGLLASPPHRANMLSASFHTVGIGVVNGGVYGLMITEDFTD